MKEHLSVLLAALAVLAVGYGGYLALFADPTTGQLMVTAVAGDVTRVAPDGREEPAGTGDFLTEATEVRVGESGHVLLEAGEGTELRLEDKTSVRVLAADRRGVRVELDEGRVQARVRPGSRVLGVRAGGRTATAQDGRFRMARDAEGMVRIAVDEGKVALDGPDGPAELSAGSRLDAAPGQAPVIQDRVMEELLLEMRWPELTPGEAPAPIGGRTLPHALVRVRGPQGTTALRADAEGQFYTELDMPLDARRMEVEVEVEDGLGAERSAKSQLERPVEAPVASTEVRFGG